MRFLGSTIPEVLLRVAVGFSFLYPPIDAVFEPDSWIGYFPGFVRAWPVDPHLLLHGFGLIEIALAIWILTGWRVRLPALLAGIILLVIVGFNLPGFSVLFRDISIALAAFALALWPQEVHG